MTIHNKSKKICGCSCVGRCEMSMRLAIFSATVARGSSVSVQRNVRLPAAVVAGPMQDAKDHVDLGLDRDGHAVGLSGHGRSRFAVPGIRPGATGR